VRTPIVDPAADANARFYRTRLYAFWCLLYAVLGVISIAAGVFLLVQASRLGSGTHDSADQGIKAVGVILVIFGIARIVNSAYVLKKMKMRVTARRLKDERD
jgi:hypothetical protein